MLLLASIATQDSWNWGWAGAGVVLLGLVVLLIARRV
jgi:hypothetical protein